MTRRNETIAQTAKRIAEQYSRVLVGLAHYDEGKKVPGCDCCYCSKEAVTNEQGCGLVHATTQKECDP